MRKKDGDEKIMDSTADTSATRGITMDQRIEIKNLNVRQHIFSRQMIVEVICWHHWPCQVKNDEFYMLGIDQYVTGHRPICD